MNEARLSVREYMPFELIPWSSADCAEYLGVSADHFRRRIACRPDFPQPMRNMKKHWMAGDVVQWARG